MTDFLIYIAKSSGFLALFYLSYRVFLSKETFFRLNRFFLFTGILLSLVLPLLTITRIVDAVPVTYALASTGENPVAREVVTGPDVWRSIFWVYISGVVFFFGRLIIQLISLYRFFRGCKKYRQNGVTVYKTSRNITPFSFFNSIVYNPEMYSNQSELNIIVRHESVHVKQKHSIDVMCIHLLVIFQWCNPLVWLYKKAVTENLEYLADGGTVQDGFNKKDYQYLLLQQAGSHIEHIPVTNTFFNSLIKKRVIMLNKNNSNRKQLWKYGIVIPVLTVFLFAVNTETMAQEKVVDDKVEMEDALLIIDGKVSERSHLNNLDETSIADMSVLKTNAVEKYGERGRNGVIEIFTKAYRKKHPQQKNTIRGLETNGTVIEGIHTGNQYFLKDGKIRSNGAMSNQESKPLFVIDGKEQQRNFDLNTFDEAKIMAIHILKREKAIEKYGKEKGKNGVVEITTK